jgi:hypothetical protein
VPDTAPDTTPHGQVLFERSTDGESTTQPQPSAIAPDTATPNQATVPDLTDAQRSSILFTDYDLDARITPATSRLAMRARLTLRNSGSEPLIRIPLQISSSLNWDSATLIDARPIELPIAQHLLETDADHTGKANELVLTLPSPLAPGATLTLDTFYSGPITADATRLDRIGASPAQSLNTDWDTIGSPTDNDESSSSGVLPPPTNTLDAALRGFGNVLWYPVAAPQLFLGDGAKLFQAVGQLRLAESKATIHLHLAVEYAGDAPTAVYFCGRRQPLKAIPDDPNQPTAAGTGIATADFPTDILGFRQPSLFIVERPESLIAPLPEAISSSAAQPALTSDAAPATGAPMLAVETNDDGTLPKLAASAQSIAPILQRWYGPHPLTALTILDHPGDPFEDGPLLVAPAAALASSTSAPALAHSLTHAWVQTGQPWFDEGLAQFTSLLWTEQDKGRDAAILQLNNLIQPLNLAEPGFDSEQAADAPTAPIGQPLVAATDELYYRRKAAAVWWMLRGIAGDEPLAQALTAWRTQPFSHDNATVQAVAFEKLLEKTSGKDLSWFFADWVLRDRGLPDLSIVAVEPRQLPAGQGHDSGWLVAVTVRNDGAPAVEVPVIIRSGTFSTTKSLRIAGFSNVTQRFLVEAPPTQVVLNDGSTPEIRSSTHVRDIGSPAAQ